MIRQKYAIWLFFLLIFSGSARAQETERHTPLKYRIQLIIVADTNPLEYLLVIDNVGFKSVASLKRFVGTLPADSILEWAPDCSRIGGEPLLSSEEEMNDFKAFCQEKHIKLILHPSG